MKKLLYTLSFTVLTGALYWVFNPSQSVYNPREKAHLYDQNHAGEFAGIGFDEAMAYHHYLAANQETQTLEPWMVQEALKTVNRQTERRLGKPITWDFAGPDNVGGRTRAYIIDRDNPNIRFSGGVSGGLFVSNNNGFTWSAVNPMQENLNISCMTQTLDRVIYYGTGEGGFVSNSGTKDGTPGFIHGGVFKSDDGGQTFSQLSNTVSFGFISAIASDSLVPSRVWVGTQTGLRYSDDQGASWTQIPFTGNTRDVQIGPDGTIFVYSGNQILRSTDGGASFSALQVNFNHTAPDRTASVSRIRIAVSPQDPNYVYLLAAGGLSGVSGVNHLVGIYRSKDKGDNFELIQRGGSILYNPISQIGTLQGQGNFDLCITVDPENKDRVIVAGVQIAEWNNGEARIIGSLVQSPVNPAYIHADKHEFLWDYTTKPPTLITLTDGGMFHSADKGRTFAERTRNFTTTQFYGLAANQSGHIVGGTQDNGTLFINGRGNTPLSSVRLLGGDGFQNEISRLNNNIIFAESQYGNLRRSVNGGVSFAPIWDNRLVGTGAGTNPQFADFNAQFKLWEDDNTGKGRLFFCTRDDVWMATDALNPSEVPSWYRLAGAGGGGLGGGRIIDIEYTPDGGSLFVAKGTNLFRIDGINLATFDTNTLSAEQIAPEIIVSNIGTALPNNRVITSLNLDPNNPNRALITLGNYNNQTYVFLSENILDAQPTFTNVTGAAIRFPVYDAIISATDPNYFVAATEFGIWATENGGNTWVEQNEGMARVATYIIRQYEWNEWEGPRVYIATHGTGFYRSNSLLTNVSKPKMRTNTASMHVYPNPANQNLNFSFELLKSTENGSAQILDMTGKEVKSIPLGGLQNGLQQKSVYVGDIKAGNYILKVQAGNQMFVNKISVLN